MKLLENNEMCMFSETVDISDPVELWSNKIAQIISKPLLLAELRTNVASFAREHWSWSNCAQKYYTIFKNLS